MISQSGHELQNYVDELAQVMEGLEMLFNLRAHVRSQRDELVELMDSRGEDDSSMTEVMRADWFHIMVENFDELTTHDRAHSLVETLVDEISTLIELAEGGTDLDPAKYFGIDLGSSELTELIARGQKVTSDARGFLKYGR